MSRLTNKNIGSFVRYFVQKRFGLGPIDTDHDIDNDTPFTWSNAADTLSRDGIKLDTDDVFRIDRGAMLGARQTQDFYFPTAGTLVTQTFFIATRPMLITSISEIHSTAETASGTATLAVFKDTGASTAPGGGATTMVGTFNLKGTANTLQTATLLAPNAAGASAAGIVLNTGDRLSIVVGGTAVLSAEAGVTVSVQWAPGYKETNATYFVQANGSIATAQTFFLANTDYVVTGVQAIWSTAGTTTTIDVTQETTTGAPASGTTILSATIDGSAAANTVVNGSLTATAANLIIRAGNRLSLKLANKGALAGLVIVVQMESIGPINYVGQLDLMWANAAAVATEAFFIADRVYEVVDVSGTWATASGGGGTLDVTIDKGVVAPGSGTAVNSSSIALSGTANTVVVGTMSVSRRNRLMNKGDVLSAKVGSPAATAGLAVAVSLMAR
jgi:hypothetical protein